MVMMAAARASVKKSDFALCMLLTVSAVRIER
jgi:hypothetical protein